MPDRELVGKMVGNFRIGRMLGQGGMGAVYEATDVSLQRQVAIKVMHSHLASQSSFQQRFLQEARTAARLSHPNIVRLLSFDKVDNQLFIIMELINGGNLRTYMKRLKDEGSFIDYPEAIEVMAQLAEALDYAHQQGMIHMDIKPDNVVLQPDKRRDGRINYRPVLTDFGLAQITIAGEAAITDQPLGTYAYMSPEQCLAERIDARTDIYSLGVMLYELAVGQLPFNPRTIAEAARMHGREPLTLPSVLRRGFPEELEAIIVQCLHKKPERRFQTSDELASALRALQTPIEQRDSAPQIAAIMPLPVQKEPEEISTDLITVFAERPLAPELPPFDPPQRTLQEKSHDHLIFYSKQQQTFVVALVEPVVTIGRGQDQDIKLKGQNASRAHARLERKPNGRYYLIDLGSTNGTYVNDHRLDENAPEIITFDSLMRMGDYWVVLHQAEAVVEGTGAAQPDDLATDPGLNGAVVPVMDGHRTIEDDARYKTDAPSAAPAVPGKQIEPRFSLNTEPMPVPLPIRMPNFSPAPMTQEQVAYGRVIFHSELYPVIIFTLNREQITIGRADDRDIVLQGESISGHHARLDRLPDGVYIMDMGSTNGVWVGTERIPPNTPTRLEAETITRMGDYWMKFDPKRDIPIPSFETALDVERQDTVAMVKPLPQEMPPYSAPPLSAEQRSRDRLIFYSEDHPLQVVSIEKETMTIGRSSNQDIQLQGKRVSRRHAVIECRPDGRLYVTDVGSTNRTWIEDTQLVPDTRAQWEPNETLRLAHYWVKFERGSGLLDVFEGSGYLQDDRGLIGKTIKTYRIDRFLGQGPVAAVYKATDIELDRPVALRILHPNLASEEVLRRRFLQEARNLSRLEHPGIVQILSFDNFDNEIFMVMALIEGGSLRAYIDRLNRQNRSIELSEAVDMAIKLADALHYAHQQNVLHRGITPTNIVLKPAMSIGPLIRYDPMLSDFGMVDLAESGEVFMTAKPEAAYPYMSPEECLSRRIDARSDIYEIGVILYEMITGKPPFEPRSIAEAVRMHVHEAPRPPAELHSGSDFPDDLTKVILRCLEKDPNNRYQTADQLSRALQRTTIGMSPEGSISSGYLSVRVDEHVTQGMDRPIPKEMPPATRYPRLNATATHDQLVIFSENFPTRVVSLRKDLYTIGRGDDQDIVLDSRTVSRRHARIERASEDVDLYRIMDVGSKNGSFLGAYSLIQNIAELWEIDETVRIGDYWLRIETVRSLDVDNYIIPDQDVIEAKEDESAKIPVIQLPPPEHDKIGLVVSNSTVRVEPGSSVTMPIEVTNKSDRVDHFKVELAGLPEGWYTQPVQALYLLPQNRETTSITFHPPMSSSSSAGGHAFEVRVGTRAQNINSVAVQGSLIIAPFNNYVANLEPERIRRKGLCEVRITNTGNTYGTYTVQARDREQALRFEQSGKQYTLAPGQSEYVPIRVSSKRRPFFGRPQSIPFEVNVTPDKEALAPQPQQGELIVYSRFSILTVIAVIIAFLLCAGAFFLTYRQLSSTRAGNQTATVVAFATREVATATASALDDRDGDGLTNAQEIELGTDPDGADTDADGIPDGEEIRIWGTDPLKRDSDNDNISDGVEVNELGSNPLSTDTDGDGIPDNVDSNPSLQATETPTPFPTLEAGVECPGSPSPPRLRIGMNALVEGGGVANRLRTAPSVGDGAIVGFMQPGQAFQVVGGPVCDETDFIRWWEVDYRGLVAWTAEGEGDEYYLRPPDVADGSGGGGGAAAGAGPSDSADIDLEALEIANRLNGQMIGVQIDPNSSFISTAMDQLETLGVGWVKIQVSWRQLQPDAPHVFDGDMGLISGQISGAKDRGYNVLVSVAKAPDWARSTQEAEGPPDDPADFARFLTDFLERTGSNIDAIEVWNEPNIRYEWTSPTLPFSGEGYMTIFEPAYEAIRAYSPDMIIVTAGLAPTDTLEASVNDRDYLTQMYNAGLADYGDVVVGVHPYGWSNPFDSRCCGDAGRGWDTAPQFYFLDTIADYRGITLNFNHNVQLWATEFGWATWEGLPGGPPQPWMVFNTLADQSYNTRGALGIAQALDFMGPMFLWNLNFANAATIANGNQIAGYSMLVADGNDSITVRPIFDDLALAIE